MAVGLIDTTVVVDLNRGYRPAVDWVAQQTHLGVSRIIYMEMIIGAPNKSRQDSALRLLRQFELVEMANDDIEWATRQLRTYFLSHGVGMNDCLIAAPAHRLQLPLYTQNLKHFAPLLGQLALKPY